MWEATPPYSLFPTAQKQMACQGEMNTPLPQIYHGRGQDFKGHLLFLKGLRGTLQDSEASNYKG